MTLPVFAAALDAAAVGAMVSVVGSYTLEALRDSELRAQHKQQCAERLKKKGGQAQYSEQAILANLDWGIDALEEAITTNNHETKVARLDHAEKMLQVCALLDTRATTAGVSNCYLSSWAHFNLAFVWKLRSNDRTAANHMLEMFLVDPFYSRVDFAPSLWEHLFLPHLFNIVNWYTKQRTSIAVSGTLRKLSEENDISLEISKDFAANPVNVFNLSADRTSQLQALEKLYQDSLDENTRQYARYYKDWLNYDTANKKGKPLMPIAEPPMTPMAETWVPPTNLPTEPSSSKITLPVADPIQLGQDKRSSLSRHASALRPLNVFKDFNNPEFVGTAELPNVARDGLEDDPDSPNSNFRRPGRELQEPLPTTNSPSKRPGLSRTSAATKEDSSLRMDTAKPPSIPNAGEIRSFSESEDIRDLETLNNILGMKPSTPISSFWQRPDARDYYPADTSPKMVDKKVPELRENSSSPAMSHDSPRGQMGLRASRLNNTSSSRYRNAESKGRRLDRRAESEDNMELPPNGRHPSEGLNRSSNGSPGGSSEEDQSAYSLRAPTAIPEEVDSSNDFSDMEVSDAPQIQQDSKVEPRQRNGRDSNLSNNAIGKVSTTRTRFLSKYGNDGHGGSSPGAESYRSDEDEYNSSYQSSPIKQPRSTPLRGRASERYQTDDGEPIVAQSGPLLGRSSERYRNGDDEYSTGQNIKQARPGPLRGRASRRYQNDADEPIVARSGPLLGRASESVYPNDDNECSKGQNVSVKQARSGPFRGRASGRYRSDEDEPIVAQSGPLLGRASERYQNDDGESVVARSGPFRGRASERYQSDEDEPNVAKSGPLLGRASERYQNGGGEPIVARSGGILRTESVPMNSASARDRGISRRPRRSGSLGSISSPTSNATIGTPLTRPPKDFVCPITSQLFNDPVTLETGQTYERVAIQQWLNTGNVTCPITRQKLRQNHLPKTNYVLRRLVNSWKEQYPEVAVEFCSSPLVSGAAATVQRNSEVKENAFCSSPFMDSPGSGRTSRRFSRRTLTNNNDNDKSRPVSPLHVDDKSRPVSPVDVDGLITDLKPAMSYLCTSENLAESGSVIVEIARLIQQARGDQRLVSILNKAGALAVMMDILFNSQEDRVLNATLFLLSILVTKDGTARQAVVSADSVAGCLIGLLRKGLTSSVPVLYQLKLPTEQLISLDLLPLLVVVVKENEENQGDNVGNEQADTHSLMMRPKSAAIMLLDQIVMGGDETKSSQNARALLALQAVPSLVSSLDETKDIDVLTSVVYLLLCCIKSDGRSRNMIAKITNLATVVDLLLSGNDRARTVAITFLDEMVHLNRRVLCTDILKKLKAEGSLSSMRVLLVYLQMAPLEHRPVAASLLLQLDLLEEPWKRSMYREEAVESLVEALNSTDWPCPAIAAKTLVALGGRFSYSGKPLMKAWLLKIAGVDKYHLSLTKNEQDSNDNDSTFDQEVEEKTAKAWERRVAGALVGHNSGTLIEALGQGIQSKKPELSKPCMIVATWLTYMLPKLADTGVRQTARNCLLDHFVVVLQTSKDLQQRILAALAVQSFISDPEGVQELLSYVKDISGPLRQLKNSTWTAKEILRAIITKGDPNLDIWVHAEQGQLDVTANGEVRALVRAKTRIFSGHSDGTIKIWEARKGFPVALQELKEHTKSVMALTVSLTKNRMYSGSLDKSIRVWELGAEEIYSIHAFNLKDAVVGLVVDGPMACILPQGAGIKVQYEETTTKTLNSHKHVQSLAISDGKIFCGCADNSVQGIYPLSESVEVIQHGVRTLMGKKPIRATQVFQGHLYVAGAPVEGVAGKVWKLADYSLVGTLSTSSEVRSMAVSEDFIYLGSYSGVIEVWLRERLLRVSTLNTGSKVISLMHDDDTLYSGHEDGKIRVSIHNLYEKSFNYSASVERRYGQ